MRRHLTVENAVSFNVHEPEGATDTARGRYGRDFPGPVRPRLEWRTELREAPGEPVPARASGGRVAR